jgi:hypothetical protein
MSATIDGTVWTASRAVDPDLATTLSDGHFEINASDCVDFLSINVGGVKGPGTYPVLAMYKPEPFDVAGP